MATRTSDHIDQQGNLTGLTLDPNHSSAPINVNQHHASFFNFLSFRVSDFHASLTIRDSGFAFGLNIPVWEAVWKFDSILLGTLGAASFKESAQLNPVFYFFFSWSLVQAILALVCSTVLVIVFSGNGRHQHHSVREDRLSFLFCNLWDQFSLPAVSTVWSVLTFMIALFVDAVWPTNAVQNDSLGRAQRDTLFAVAKVMSFVVLCIAAVRFGVFMAHLRRVSQEIGHSESAV